MLVIVRVALHHSGLHPELTVQTSAVYVSPLPACVPCPAPGRVNPKPLPCTGESDLTPSAAAVPETLCTPEADLSSGTAGLVHQGGLNPTGGGVPGDEHKTTAMLCSGMVGCRTGPLWWGCQGMGTSLRQACARV